MTDEGRPVFVRPNEQPAPIGDVDASGQPVFVDRPDDMNFPPEDPERPWPGYVAPVTFIASFLAIIVASGVFVALIGGGGDSVDRYDYLFGLLQDLLWILVSISIPLAMVRWIKPEHLGLRRRHLGFSILKGIVVIIGFYGVAAVYASALGLDENSNKLLQDTGFGDALGKDIAYALLYPVAAPVAEELLFRGVLFKGLRDSFRGRFGRGPAVALGAVLSGVIFGALHLGGGQDDFIPVLIALGILLALAYEWSGTLYVPIFIHATNNAIATGNSADPTHDWVIGLIAAGPFIAVAVAVLIGRLVRRLPSARPPAVPPSTPTPPSGGAPQSPTFHRPQGL
ncbi:MAG: type II CAAX endopeptidase family protein [Patulibacter minatonensis]